MLIHFTKMHGLGNDFVVIELISQRVKLGIADIKRICHRHLGIGCDQLILIEPPKQSTSDFYYRIFNANGQEVEQCGNGARCAARFFVDLNFSNRTHLVAECLAGILECELEKEGIVSINLGVPSSDPKALPFNTEHPGPLYPIAVDHHEFLISVVSVGNPHAIIDVGTFDPAMVKKLGPSLSQHPDFPKQTNVEFMQIVNRNHIRCRVYERGVGETLACGSGAAAAVVSGISRGLLDSPTEVSFSLGTLKIHWAGVGEPVYLSGPTKIVFSGQFLL